jgi:hypothetical protein
VSCSALPSKSVGLLFCKFEKRKTSRCSVLNFARGKAAKEQSITRVGKARTQGHAHRQHAVLSPSRYLKVATTLAKCLRLSLAPFEADDQTPIILEALPPNHSLRGTSLPKASLLAVTARSRRGRRSRSSSTACPSANSRSARRLRKFYWKTTRR